MLTKTSLAGGKVKRSTAMNCLLVNQLATPGLGSLMAGRVLAGTIQLGLAIVGFCMVMGWFYEKGVTIYRMASESPEMPELFPWLGVAGFGVFVLSWLLSWPTSISLLRDSRLNKIAEPAAPAAPPKPPKLDSYD